MMREGEIRSEELVRKSGTYKKRWVTGKMAHKQNVTAMQGFITSREKCKQQIWLNRQQLQMRSSFMIDSEPSVDPAKLNLKYAPLIRHFC